MSLARPAPAAPTSRAPAPWLVTSSLVLLCLIWGSTWLVIKGGLEDLPPFSSAGVRFLVAALVVTALAPRLRGREGGDAPRAAVWGTVGAVNFALSYGIVYWSETRLPSGIVAVLWSLYPMCQAICGHFLLSGERLRGVQWAGFAVGLLGVALLFLTDLRSFGPEGVPTALVLCASPVVTAVGTTVLKRYGSGSSSVLVNRNAMWTGAVLLLAVAGLTERGAEARWTPAAIGSVAYLAVFGTVVTFMLYFWLLRHAAAHKMSLVAYVVPALALLLGGSVGGEPVRLTTVAGALLILLGVGSVMRLGPRRWRADRNGRSDEPTPAAAVRTAGSDGPAPNQPPQEKTG